MCSKDPKDLRIKLTDFGFAIYFDIKEGLSEVCGSPIYMAPEIVNKESYNHKVDIWSAGILTHKLLSGEYPL